MRVAFSLLAVLLFVTPAYATSYRDISLEEMTQRSTIVVEADVVSTRFVPRSGKMPVVTLNTLKVVRYLRGQGDKTIELWQPGGVLGKLNYGVSGSPTFSPGQRVILFLKPKPGYPEGTYYLFGLELGAYNVSPGPDGTSWATRATASPAARTSVAPSLAPHAMPVLQSSQRLPLALPRWQLVSRVKGAGTP